MTAMSVHREHATQWGDVISDRIVPAGQGIAFEARAGDHIIVTDLEGAQIGDFVAFLTAANGGTITDLRLSVRS